MNTTLRERLKQSLSENNMTQSELANKVGCSKSIITQYLLGQCNPKQDMIYKISQVLNISPGWLMGFSLDEEEAKQEVKSRIVGMIDTLTESELVKLEKLIILVYDK